jgi:hygromycin-B 4-O-kinase
MIGRHFAVPVEHLELLEGGQVARTWAFSVDANSYILRINRQLGANVGKEMSLAQLLSGTGIPVPEVLFHGRAGSLHYSITRRMPGTPASDLAGEAADGLAPSLLDMLAAIHSVDTSGTAGFGPAGNDSNGLFPSWAAWLVSVRDEEPEWDFFGAWHELFDTTFLERPVFDAASSRMEDLLPSCPEDRTLIHGNFGFGNVLVQDGRLTAMLDWQEAGYGDALYDIAWLDFWDPEAKWPDRAMAHSRGYWMNAADRSDRIECYQLRIGLNAMRFFAKKHDEGAYRWVCRRILPSGG